MTEKHVKTNLLNVNVWIRLLYMALFALLLTVARVVVWFVAALQFLLVLITGSDNRNLRHFGQGLGKWVYQGLLFLTFNSEEKPFPFSDWPEVEVTEDYIAPVPEPAPAPETAPQPEATDAEPTADDVPSFTDDNSDADSDRNPGSS